MWLQKVKIILTITTFKDFSLFENFFFLTYFLQNKLKQLFFTYFFKKVYKKLIILKSPFVNKKARNQLGAIFFKGKLILNFQYKIVPLFFFTEFIQFLRNKLVQNKIFIKIIIIHFGFLF